ncbi:copper resistance CopC family protein [Pseudonocardia zijingensis]|jgi:methionine-rich copper-binding protein CopC|uniref:CopC domain-containing protein n=1 Tax=Pseudonocardia zijingensis TaxID=153376 RepID=A0ABN1PKU8_9PSEU
MPPPTHRLLRALAVGLLAALALLLGATPALAHSRLESSDPADGASLDSAPERITLTFNEDPTPGFSEVTVVGPDQVEYQSGDVTIEGSSVRVGVQPLGPAGTYRIGYRVVSADGHPIVGEVAFTLTAPGPGAAAPSTEPAPQAQATPAPAAAAPSAGSDGGGDGGAPVWPWIVGAVVLVGGGVTAALRLGRG